MKRWQWIQIALLLYGKLLDKFGDNGVVSIVIGRIDGENHDELHMELWLMSCRVLKRDMEFAMMDELVEKARTPVQETGWVLLPYVEKCHG